MPGGRRCSAVSRAAISGRGVRKTVPARSAASATRISWAWTGQGGGRFSDAAPLAAAIAAAWVGGPKDRLVVLTGGEPLLQVDTALIEALHAQGFEIAVETNGTIAPPDGLDWICVSPKADAPLVVRAGHELKLVFPQEQAWPTRFEGLDFQHFLLQPMDGPERQAHTEAAIAFCLAHPNWRLSVQSHKFLGIR